VAKNNLKHIILTLLFSIITIAVFSQENDNQLALKYYKNKEFDKASDLYLKLYSISNNQFYLSYFLNCLVELKDFENAEKFLKKEIKRNPQNTSLYVEYGSVLKVQNKNDKAIEQFDLAVKNASANAQEIINLSNTFISKQEFSYAEIALRKGQKTIKDYEFELEIANLFYIQRNYSTMINEYLNLLEKDPFQIDIVQNKLQNSIYNSTDETMMQSLKENLMKRIQKSPDVSIFSDLLIWIYLQDKDFENAYTYSIAIDKRKKESGERLMNLGKIASTNEIYDVAIKSYKYVIEKGDKFENYYIAKSAYLNALYKKIRNTETYTKDELLSLESNYIQTIAESGKTNETAELIKDLAHLQGFYLAKPDVAIKQLEEAIEIPNLQLQTLNQCKLELGDLYLLNNDVWTATIFYGQVEKNNPNSPISAEAKFKKAKLAYFMGDFKWAEAQLDVLKASTSKLIANDAFYLATIISDNTIMDTIVTPLQMYARAELLLFQKHDSLALLTLDSILEKYKNHSLADDILYLKAQIELNKKQFVLASDYFKKIIENYEYDILADDALFKLAVLTEENLKQTEVAKELYNKLLTNYSNSIYVTEARRRFRTLRGDFKIM
jgi:TolA-binding protein/lipopolysaccharide biosynthesis regulator YciM